MINNAKYSVMISKIKILNKQHAKARMIMRAYMISGTPSDFRSHEAKRKCCNLCAFRTHVISEAMYFPIFEYVLPDFWICNKNITKNYKIISDYIISYLYLYNQ